MLSEVKRAMSPEQPAKWHQYANLFPWLDGAAADELKADIAENGVLEPIVFYRGELLDGRNRYMAARDLGIEFPYCEYLGDDPLGFVISRNLKRRHLTEAQRARIADDIAKLPRGANQHTAMAVSSFTQAEAAAAMDVSVDSVQRVRKVREKGVPELDEAVQAGDASLRAAADVAALPKEEQQEIVAKGEAEILAAAKRIRAERQAEKAERRTERESELAARIVALPDKKFGVIYADPPWSFQPYSRKTGMDRAADNHYPTSHLEDIMALPVSGIAADDCALFLWATAPMLPQALRVMEAWGFEYKSQMVWVKRRPGDARGTGYWFYGEHELLLLGTKGNVPAPQPGTQYRSVLAASVGKHSEKPDAFYEVIETYFPNLPKIELNARGPARAGWDVWGAEAVS